MRAQAVGLSGRLLLALAAAAVVWGVVAAGPAAGSVGRGFEPGYAMSKQYVAVTVYKILRDHAPDTVGGCERNVKEEPDRFDDLDSAPAFTRGSINCLDKLGYLEGLPGGSASGPSFEPGYAMSKQYVAVTVYKILRDHAPDTVGGCERNVKEEPDRFDDLDSAPAFTRGSINCLDKLGYLEGLPGGSQNTDTGTRPATYKAVIAGGDYVGDDEWGTVLSYSCALRTDNTITCWGNNDEGQTDAPDGQYKAVDAGDLHSCALRTDNTITCWGANAGGQTDAPDGQYKAVSAGGSHSCALRTDNTIICWGWNDWGQADAPDGQYKTVAAGDVGSCAIRTDKTITCWGDVREQTDPPDGQYETLTAGVGYYGSHWCALRIDNTITCWSNSIYGGQADAPDGHYKAVAAGYSHSCAIRTDNTIECWGANGFGQADAPDGHYKAVAAGWDHSCAIKTDNTIACWGNNEFGQADPPDS